MELVEHKDATEHYFRRADNNLRHGPFTCYYPTGELRDKGTYNNGKIDGEHTAYHRNGKLWFRYMYHNGERHGESIEWWEEDGTVLEHNYWNKNEQVINLAQNPISEEDKLMLFMEHNSKFLSEYKE